MIFDQLKKINWKISQPRVKKWKNGDKPIANKDKMKKWNKTFVKIESAILKSFS